MTYSRVHHPNRAHRSGIVLSPEAVNWLLHLAAFLPSPVTPQCCAVCCVIAGVGVLHMDHTANHVCSFCLYCPTIMIQTSASAWGEGLVSSSPAWVLPWIKESGQKDKVLKRMAELSEPEQTCPPTKASMELDRSGQPSRTIRPTRCRGVQVLCDAAVDDQTPALAHLRCPCFHLAQAFSSALIASPDSCHGHVIAPVHQSTENRDTSPDMTHF